MTNGKGIESSGRKHVIIEAGKLQTESSKRHPDGTSLPEKRPNSSICRSLYNRLLNADDERHAFKPGQPVWICYEDTSGTVTEQVVETYRSSDDSAS